MSTALSAKSLQETILDRTLFQLCDYVLSQPGKGLRRTLVDLGCRLAGSDPESNPELRARVDLAASIVERIHAGSLVVDDIEDGSLVRRGVQTLHERFGVALALNAGNWLYFSPLTALPELRLSTADELELNRDILKVLDRAHCGQALDIGTRVTEIERKEIPQFCQSVMEWKTGEFTGLAIKMGAYLAGASSEDRARLFELGKQLGVGLQMLDDLGNFSLSEAGPMAAKRWEDLRLGRPSWVWSFLASELSASEFESWLQAVSALPATRLIEEVAADLDLIRRAREAIGRALKAINRNFARDFGRRCGWAEVGIFIEKLERAYV